MGGGGWGLRGCTAASRRVCSAQCQRFCDALIISDNILICLDPEEAKGSRSDTTSNPKPQKLHVGCATGIQQLAAERAEEERKAQEQEKKAEARLSASVNTCDTCDT